MKQPDSIAIAVKALRSNVGICTIEVMWDDARNEPWTEASGSWGGSFAGVADLRKWARRLTTPRTVILHASRDDADCDSIEVQLVPPNGESSHALAERSK